MTPDELLSVNELARLIYKEFGCVARKGFDFSTATHPMEMAVYRASVAAHRFFDPDFEGREGEDE